MKKIVIALIASLCFPIASFAQIGSPQTKSSLNTEINTNFPNNSVGAITPQILRQTTLDMVASWQQFGCVNAQTGTTYTVAVTDFGCLVTFSNASGVAVSLPQATSGFNPFNATISALASAGSVVVTPTASTINGASSYTVKAGQSVWIISDGTNYQIANAPTNITGAVSSVSNSDGTLTIGPTVGAVVASLNLAHQNNWGLTVGTAASVALTSGGSTTPGVTVSSAGSPMGLYFGSGAPTVSAPAGSMYWRSDCSSASTCTYVNTNGSTGWSALGGGGGGSPGGSTGNAQYNAGSSTFGGISGANSDGTNLTFGNTNLRILGSSTGYNTLSTNNAGASNFTSTLQAATDTIVDRATTDTLTNKTLTSSTNSLGGVTAAFGSDAKGDTYTNSGSSNVLQRVAIGASGTFYVPSSGLPAWVPMSGDCTLSVGAITCLKTNGTNFGTAATQNTGTSGATLPFLNGSNTWSGVQTFGEVLGAVTSQSGTTYTFAAGDCGTEVRFTSSSAVTATIPATLPAGCNIAVAQLGTAKVSVNGSAVTPATLHSAHSYTGTFAQYAVIGINIDANPGGSSADALLTGDGS